MAKIKDLYDFIERAEKNRKYVPNTALGLKAALRLFDAEANNEELGSIDKFKENIEQIYHGVSLKNKNMAASSLATYKARVLKVIQDYEKYGADPTKINTWVVKVRSVAKKQKENISLAKTRTHEAEKQSEPNSIANFVFDFRGGISLTVPRNQKTSDAIADGELKNARQVLSQFADDFMVESSDTEKDSDLDT